MERDWGAFGDLRIEGHFVRLLVIGLLFLGEGLSLSVVFCCCEDWDTVEGAEVHICEEVHDEIWASRMNSMDDSFI